MTIDLDPSSPIPVYLQIVEQFRRLIALGGVKPGDQLPTVRDLAVQCRVNRNTAARAIQELEREQLVRTRVGQGTFVAENAPRLEPDERDARVDAQVDRLLFEAQSLRIPLEQLPGRLWRRIEAFRKRREETGVVPAAAGSGARTITRKEVVSAEVDDRRRARAGSSPGAPSAGGSPRAGGPRERAGEHPDADDEDPGADDRGNER